MPNLLCRSLVEPPNTAGWFLATACGSRSDHFAAVRTPSGPPMVQGPWRHAVAIGRAATSAVRLRLEVWLVPGEPWIRSHDGPEGRYPRIICCEVAPPDPLTWVGHRAPGCRTAVVRVGADDHDRSLKVHHSTGHGSASRIVTGRSVVAGQCLSPRPGRPSSVLRASCSGASPGCEALPRPPPAGTCRTPGPEAAPQPRAAGEPHGRPLAPPADPGLGWRVRPPGLVRCRQLDRGRREPRRDGHVPERRADGVLVNGGPARLAPDPGVDGLAVRPGPPGRGGPEGRAGGPLMTAPGAWRAWRALTAVRRSRASRLA